MSLHYFTFVLLVSVVLLVRAKDESNETHSGEQECYDNFCDAHSSGAHNVEEYMSQLCEPACEEELEIDLRVAHLNYDHVRTAFATSILIMVVISAKLCE